MYIRNDERRILHLTRYNGDVDLSLIQFRRPYVFSDKVKAAKLPEKLLDNAGTFIGVGVGSTPKNDTKIPGLPPRKIKITGLSDEDCKEECKRYPACVDEHEGMIISEDFICGRGKDNIYAPLCGGDSGGL